MPPRKKEFSYKPGEKVTAKWPGSNVYYAGVVTKLRRDHQYEIKFGDDSVHTIQPRNVHSPTTHEPSPQSPPSPSSSHDSGDMWTPANLRTKTPRAAKSKSKSKSPSRGRTTKSKSPSRSRKAKPSKSPSTPSSTQRKSPRSRSRTRNTRSRSRTPVAISKSNSLSTRSRVSTRISAQTSETQRSIFVKPTEDKLYRMGFRSEWEPQEAEDAGDTVGLDEPFSVVCRRVLLCSAIGAYVVLMPLLVFYINLTCDRADCELGAANFPSTWNEYFELETVAVFVCWLLFQASLAIMPFGELAEGQPLVDAQRLSYRINGAYSLFVTLGVLGGLLYLKVPFDFVLDKLLQLITASIFASYAISALLLFRARKTLNRNLTPSVPNDSVSAFFYGRELNPRVGDLDVKFFFLLRPKLIGWAVLDVLILYQEYETSDSFYPSIWLVGIGQLIYIFDSLMFEEAFLSGFDITKEGCGFMVVFGGLCFAPFCFSLSLRYLLLHRPHVDPYVLIASIFLALIGYGIYRVANKQKDDFRRNPYHKKFIAAKTIDTKTTRKIFVDGWWKHLRHPNYFGDLMIALSWSLPCGLEHTVPHAYFIYLFITLIHRAYRDDKACLKKYGDAWVSYCKHVPCRVVPYCY